MIHDPLLRVKLGTGNLIKVAVGTPVGHKVGIRHNAGIGRIPTVPCHFHRGHHRLSTALLKDRTDIRLSGKKIWICYFIEPVEVHPLYSQEYLRKNGDIPLH